MLRPRISGVAPAFRDEDIEQYVRATGGDPAHYREGTTMCLPHAHVGTWALAEWSRALLAARLPLDYSRVVHAGASCRIVRLARCDEPVLFSATVETVVRTGKSVRIEQQLQTMTADAQPLAEYTLALAIPEQGRAPSHTPRPAVPATAASIAQLDLPADEGWRYARLSGDFNPVHWARPVARLLGFAGPIAHGFDLLARMTHTFVAARLRGSPHRLRAFEIQFRQPVVLPARLQVFVGEPETLATNLSRVPVWLSHQAGGVANVLGHVEIEP